MKSSWLSPDFTSMHKGNISMHVLWMFSVGLSHYVSVIMLRCGNVAAILELDEHLNKSFKVGGFLIDIYLGRLDGSIVTDVPLLMMIERL